MKAGDAAPFTAAQRAEGFRGCGAERKLHASSRRAVCYPRSRQPSGQLLEATLGIKLFNRERQRLVITGAGREYLSVVRDALDRIAMGTERLMQRQSSGALTVSTSPDFAAKWLVHRLGRFAEAHPGIDLRVSATMHHVDFAREDVEIAVRHGDGHWPGLHVTRLCAEHLFAVCSLSFAAALHRPDDVLKLPLLHLDDRRAWSAWLETAG